MPRTKDSTPSAPATRTPAVGSAGPPTEKTQKKRQFKKSTIERRNYVKQTKKLSEKDHVFRRAPLVRLIREVGASFKTDLRFGKVAVEALIQAVQQLGDVLMPKAADFAAHGNRVTIMPKDLGMALKNMDSLGQTILGDDRVRKLIRADILDPHRERTTA